MCVCVCVCVYRRPKSQRSKRFLEGRAPKIAENVKNAMIMKGGNTSETITNALKDLVRITLYTLYTPCHVYLLKHAGITDWARRG